MVESVILYYSDPFSIFRNHRQEGYLLQHERRFQVLFALTQLKDFVGISLIFSFILILLNTTESFFILFYQNSHSLILSCLCFNLFLSSSLCVLAFLCCYTSFSQKYLSLYTKHESCSFLAKSYNTS